MSKVFGLNLCLIAAAVCGDVVVTYQVGALLAADRRLYHESRLTMALSDKFNPPGTPRGRPTRP